MYVTYQDLIQVGIFVVALANLIYQILFNITHRAEKLKDQINMNCIKC